MPEITRPQLVAYALTALCVIVLGVRFMQGQAATGDEAGARPDPRSGGRPGAPGGAAGVRIEGAAGSRALVHVAGAVRRPGVYRLGAGSRVKDAVRRAGGPRRGADLNAINLAAKVSDGQQLVVPAGAGAGALPTSAGSAGEVPTGDPATAGASPQAGAPVNLNSATAEQLDTLDGVGPATARKILEWRRANGGFRSVDDLSQVPGIGPKRMAALRPRVQV